MFTKVKRTAMFVAALGALALGGSAVAAATTSTTTTSTTSTTSTTGSAPSTTTGSSSKAPPAMPAHGTAAHEDAEKAVTGAMAARVQAAAVKIVGSGTAGPVTTDYQGSGYETTVTKSDGTEVEVHLSSSLQEMSGPGGGGMPSGAMPSGAMPSGATSGARPSGSMPRGAPAGAAYSG